MREECRVRDPGGEAGAELSGGSRERGALGGSCETDGDCVPLGLNGVRLNNADAVYSSQILSTERRRILQAEAEPSPLAREGARRGERPQVLRRG